MTETLTKEQRRDKFLRENPSHSIKTPYIFLHNWEKKTPTKYREPKVKGYSALHKWVIRWKGQPALCEMCGTTAAKRFHWANIDHKYRRVLDDFIRLCTKCHFDYDRSKEFR